MGAGITNGIIPSGGGTAFRGALTKLTADEAVATNIVVPWDDVTYDTDSIWSSGASSRLTVPAGVTKVKLRAAAHWAASTAFRTAVIIKNGDEFSDQEGLPKEQTETDRAGMSLSSAVLDVIAGDYFELKLITGTGMDAIVAKTWMSMEIVT